MVENTFRVFVLEENFKHQIVLKRSPVQYLYWYPLKNTNFQSNGIKSD